MKIFFFLFIVFIQALVHQISFAQELDQKPEELPAQTVEPQVEQPAHEEPKTSTKILNIKAGASLQNYRYEEPGLISHTGILIGAWLNWNYDVPYYKGAVHAEINTGHIDYDGALCDVNSGNCVDYKSKTSELIIRLSHRLGIEITDNFQIFAGVGYRYLFDKGEGAGFYRRIGDYWILPLGFTSSIMWDELNTKVVFDYEYDHFLFGQIQSKLSDVNSTYSDVKHPQNRGRAQRIMLGFEPLPDVDSPHPWMFYFFFEDWAIPQSERAELLINGAHSGKFFYEPENRSNAYGLRVGWSY